MLTAPSLVKSLSNKIGDPNKAEMMIRQRKKSHGLPLKIFHTIQIRKQCILHYLAFTVK